MIAYFVLNTQKWDTLQCRNFVHNDDCKVEAQLMPERSVLERLRKGNYNYFTNKKLIIF